MAIKKEQGGDKIQTEIMYLSADNLTLIENASYTQNFFPENYKKSEVCGVDLNWYDVGHTQDERELDMYFSGSFFQLCSIIVHKLDLFWFERPSCD